MLSVKEIYLHDFKMFSEMLKAEINKRKKEKIKTVLNEVETYLSILNNQEKEQWEDTLKKRR